MESYFVAALEKLTDDPGNVSREELERRLTACSTCFKREGEFCSVSTFCQSGGCCGGRTPIADAAPLVESACYLGRWAVDGPDSKCDCPGPGYCERHGIEKPAYLHMLCKSSPAYFELWSRQAAEREESK